MLEEIKDTEEMKKLVMNHKNSLVEKEHEISQRYTNLKEDVLKMIDIINPKEYGLLKSLQDAIIDAQAEYYYNDAMQFEEIRRQILND